MISYIAFTPVDGKTVDRYLVGYWYAKPLSVVRETTDTWLALKLCVHLRLNANNNFIYIRHI